MQKKKENEMIERYLYDVTRRLPEKQRQDIEDELRTLIEDMLEEEQENGADSENGVKGVLEELGDPAKLAAKYRGEEHLIGGEYYPLYRQVLKIVLICVAAGMGISAAVSFFITAAGADGVIRSVQDGLAGISEIPMALISAFGMVTLVFFLMERNQVKLEGAAGAWSIGRLPQIPCRKAVISKGDSIVSIVFGVLLAVLFIFAPEFMGAWVMGEDGSVVAVSFFNLSVWNQVLPLLVASLFMGVADSLVKLIIGIYSRAVMWADIACSLVSIVLTIVLFQGYPLWNPDFVSEVMRISGMDFSRENAIMVYWNTRLGNGMYWYDVFMWIIIGLTLLDTGVTIYRTLRYGRGGNRLCSQ